MGLLGEAPSNSALSVAYGGTGAVTLSGILKGNSTSAISAAVPGTDYTSPAGAETLSNKTLTAPVINGNLSGTSIITDANLSGAADNNIPSTLAAKTYIDNAVAGLKWKAAVRVATVSAGTLSSSFANGSTVDGVVLATGDRILIKNQSLEKENGIYVVNASGAPTRSSDANTGDEILSCAVFVLAGTSLKDTGWVNTNDTAPVIGTDAITFVQFSGSGTYTASTGLTLTGNAFSIDSTVVTLTGTQTLYNKTLSAPVIGGTDFANAQHAHSGASSGGTIAYTSLTSIPSTFTAAAHDIASATYHTTSGRTAGQFIRATGATSIGWSTLTIPDTASVSTLLYASSANTISALATGNSSILITNVSGVPSWSTTLPAHTTGELTISDAANIVLGTTTGTKVGTGTNQKLGFYNATPIVQPSSYTVSNVTSDKTFDANNTTIDELADVLGTLITDLKTIGLVG